MEQNGSPNGERVVRVLGEHWIRYVTAFLVYILLFFTSGILLYLAGFTAYHSPFLSRAAFVLGLFLFLGNHHWFFAMLLSEFTEHIVVTNKRVIHMNNRLFVHDEMYEISFQKMKTVEANKEGVLQNILRYGTIRFESGARINYVPHPNAVVRDIQQAMGLR